MFTTNSTLKDKEELIVQCISEYPQSFTEGKVYRVLDENEVYYTLRDDFGRVNLYAKLYFQEI